MKPEVILRRLEQGDPLLDPPSALAPPIPDPQIQLLNFNELGWHDFQKLVVAVARDIDGHREAYEYGVPGQSQHGLDVIGANERGEVHAYQARDVKAFTESDLRQAVADFAAGKRPRNPSRFVVVVACGTESTQLLDQLTKLRQAHLGAFDIDLYGKATLSDMLRTQPEIVQRFFGSATAERFCVDALRQPVVPTGDAAEVAPTQIADAVLRGPIEALGLSAQLADADRLRHTDPVAAARSYTTIAERLASAKWPGHALMLRRRAADAMAIAGEERAAGLQIAQLFWTYLDLGADSESQMLRHELGKLAKNVPTDEDLKSWAETAKEAHNAVGDPLDRLDGLASAVDNLTRRSGDEAEALLLLCELALTSEQPDLILDRATRITDSATKAAPIPDHPSLGTRLRLCLADATGDWTSLLSDVRSRSLSQPDMSLVLGRHGRFLAWNGEPSLARDALAQAVERAVLLSANDDAREWIHATRYLDIRYGPLSDQVNEAYRRIQALNTAGSKTRLYGHLTSPREKVLRYLHDEKYPMAAEAGRRYLRECVVAGHWGSEFEAHTLLGDLYASNGEPGLAARHYVRAGEHKKLVSLLHDGPYVDVRAELSRPAPWERASVYRAVVAQADLVPDGHVNEIVGSAMVDAQSVTDGQVQQSGSAPELWASAIAALGALVERAADDLAGRALQMLLPLVERDSGKYRFTDDDHMKALAGIVQGNESHRDEALVQIGRALRSGGPFAESAMKYTGDLMAAQDAAVPILEGLASEGNDHASLLLAVRGTKSDHVLQKAKEALDRVINRPAPKSGTVTFGTSLPRDAHLIGVLPVDQRDLASRRLMQIAEDTHESDRNRADALDAISTLGGELSAENRRELYERAMRFATADSAQSDLDPDLRMKPHPLSRFRFDLSPGPLEAFGLQAAARLAQSESEIDAVVDKALSMIASSDESTTHGIASTLSWLSGPRLLASQPILAGQPNASLRALASVLWVSDANRDPHLGIQLASDPNGLVRRTLAREIAASGEIPVDNEVAVALADDERFSVRRALQQRGP